MSSVVRWIADRLGLAIGLTIALALAGILALSRLPIDAVPDVTNNQVQVVTAAPALDAKEVESTITLRVERAMAGIPGLEQVRSVSKLGVSIVTLVFRDDVPVYFARERVNERLIGVRDDIPSSLGRPELGPVATGLGEIYHFVLEGNGHDPEELRTLLDWQISPRLRQVRGVVETVNFGGSLKQYRVTLDPARLAAHAVSLQDVRAALERDNANAGGGAIEKNGEQLVLRAEARFKNLAEIAAVVVKTEDGGVPLTIGMLGEVDTGPALRNGAMTMNGRGEVVGGSVLMLKGENSREVVHRVKAEVEKINERLPKGVKIVPFLDRASFIDRTVMTVVKNLIEGATLVVVVLLLTLGSIRAGLLVAGAIPFAMLMAFLGLTAMGMSANVMSLGAVDFGIVVEGAVVVAESALHGAAHARQGDRRRSIVEGCARTARPVLFAVVIVLLVFLPLGTLQDVEGKMFRPVVVSLVFMLAGALFYALVVVPALAPALLANFSNTREPWLVRGIRRVYEPVLERALRRPKLTAVMALGVTLLAAAPATTLGAEFLPRIFEGDLAVDARRPVSVGLVQSIALAGETEKALLTVPEVERVVTRTGRTEKSVDPAGPEAADVYIVLKPRNQWRKSMTPERLVETLDKTLERRVPSQQVSFSQPIEMRVNDLIAGVKSDVAIKIFGEDLDSMAQTAEKIQKAIEATPGAADVKREVPAGLPTLRVVIDRDKAARLGVSPRNILDAVEVAKAGQEVGTVYEGERTFALVLKLGGDVVSERELRRFPVATAAGELVPLSAVANITVERGTFQISRDQLRRRLVVESNVRGRDLVSFVTAAKQEVAKIQLPPGVEIQWGGQFENFQRANQRLMLLVPVALGIIALLLFGAFRSVPLVVVTLLALPAAAAGGLVSLWIRGLPFSIPAMVGLIALAGVSVMSGVVVTTRLLETDARLPIEERVRTAAREALRPTISTALVAALGFVPMAIATSAGAEVQRPLATVVIGGLIIGVVVGLAAIPALLLLVGRRFQLPVVDPEPVSTPEANVPHASILPAE